MDRILREARLQLELFTGEDLEGWEIAALDACNTSPLQRSKTCVERRAR